MRSLPPLRRIAAVVAVGAVLAAGALAAASSASAAPPLPARMAALGDSISQATMSCSSLLSCPGNSWSTGTGGSVGSHAARLRALGATALTATNHSVPGAASTALTAQAQRAAAQGAQYVTVQIGANDACTRTVAGMTPTPTFASNVSSALATLAASPAAPEIFVASIPNLTRMYDLNKSSLSARVAWAVLQVCPSMLASPTSTKPADVQRRADVQTRVDEYNRVLGEVCAATARCRFDGGAVATYAFTKADVSTRDYFHPSLTGQTTLAALTWGRSQWVS